jgi:hypothetical protein
MSGGHPGVLSRKVTPLAVDDDLAIALPRRFYDLSTSHPAARTSRDLADDGEAVGYQAVQGQLRHAILTAASPDEAHARVDACLSVVFQDLKERDLSFAALRQQMKEELAHQVRCSCVVGGPRVFARS